MSAAYRYPMPKFPFEPCIPSPGTKVHDPAEWIHEIKHDGYRPIVPRDGKRVRLFTRNGDDWSGRFPLITDAALRNWNSSFSTASGSAALHTEHNLETGCSAVGHQVRLPGGGAERVFMAAEPERSDCA